MRSGVGGWFDQVARSLGVEPGVLFVLLVVVSAALVVRLVMFAAEVFILRRIMFRRE